jgi:hypothetical protein
MEFTFMPTREAPNHDHPDFRETMRWYHPFLPFEPHRLTAWKKQPARVQLAWSGGHIVRFPDICPHPKLLGLKHYLYLSKAHAAEKYCRRQFKPAEVAYGWHGWRAQVRRSDIVLPPAADLRYAESDTELDASSPRTRYFIEDQVVARMQRAAKRKNMLSGRGLAAAVAGFLHHL